jgi:hypothetical protein
MCHCGSQVKYACVTIIDEVFEPTKTKQILDRLKFLFTPQHDNYPIMAEIELGVLACRCLDGRIPNPTALAFETDVRETELKSNGATVDWRFTTDDVRIKLKKLYPTIHAW